MVSLRPAKCYSKVTGPAYTRKSVKVHRRNYVGGIPGSKIRMFDIGNLNGSFDRKFDLITTQNGQIRHNALESVRTTINRFLGGEIGKLNYKIKIRVYPHHILRENKQYTGAGADRIQQGMRKSFGKTIGLAARVKSNQPIITIESDQQFEKQVRDALRKAKSRLPVTSRVEMSTQKKVKVTAKVKISEEEEPVPVAEPTAEEGKEEKTESKDETGTKDETSTKDKTNTKEEKTESKDEKSKDSKDKK